MANGEYHYTESGLDSVYLLNGFDFDDAPSGRQVIIKDIDGLHRAIGEYLVKEKKDLSGKEIRFLRHEMLMSQTTLAKFLGVSEQAVHRWENGKTEQVPKPAEALIRLLYSEQIIGCNDELKKALKQIADIEDEMDARMTLSRETNRGWKLAA